MKSIIGLVLFCVVIMCSACETKVEVPSVERKEVVQSLEPKKICVNVYDAKLDKEVEKCKMMNLHKKHEGTKVPEKK